MRKKSKRENIDRVRVGTCIYLFLMLENFENDFCRLEDFITENSYLLENQVESSILKQFEDIKEVLFNGIDILLKDIDKSETYCKYIEKYY